MNIADSVITIGANRQENGKQNMYGIVFNGAKIEEFISLPSDYNISEFIDVVREKAGYNHPFRNTDVIYDDRGMGMMFKDQFINQNADINDIQIKNKNVAVYVEVAKESLIEIAANSTFDSISKMEFFKLVKELNNMIVKFRNGEPYIERLNNNLGRTRADCYLLYFSTLQGQRNFMVNG